MVSKRHPFLTKPHSAYYHREVPKEDAALMHVGPGTPAGEYLRRFWQPVAYSNELKDLPLRVRVMCEDLVLFRDKSGNVGLLELHCNHRGTSLEYGKIEDHGIRCCYHGWLFDVDGRILETPLESADSTLKDRLHHGAYAVTEYANMVFAYMGPPDKMPELPTFDLMELRGYRLESGEVGGGPNYKPCNWMHLVDNFLDPMHEEILHATNSGVQMNDKNGRMVQELAIIGEAEFIETPTGIVTLDLRRVTEDTVWVRNIEYIWPNILVLGTAPPFPVEFGPDEDEVHSIPFLIDWSVPIDDTQTMEFGLVLTATGNANPRTAEPMLAFLANSGGRTYDEMQRFPGDYEAQIGQRPIARYALEHLGVSDKGVTMMRKMMRRDIRAVQQGEDPVGVVRETGKIVPTHGGDTVLRIPSAPSEEEDKKVMHKAARDMVYRYLKSPPHQNAS